MGEWRTVPLLVRRNAKQSHTLAALRELLLPKLLLGKVCISHAEMFTEATP